MKKVNKNQDGMKTVVYGKNHEDREVYQIPKLTYSKQQLLKKMVNKWVFMGHVAADSGRLLIIDPCKMDLISDSEIHGICWDSGLAPIIQVDTPEGRPELGVIFDTGLGDGLYEVWGFVKKIPGIGIRIVEAKMEFISEDACETSLDS